MARPSGIGLAFARRRRASPLPTLVALLLAVGAALGVGADSAAAARPVKGALYGDAPLESSAVLYLRISKSGRWLNPRRSAIDWQRSDDGCTNVRLHIGSPRHPVRIKRDGRFRLVRRRGHFVFRLRGRFVHKERAHVSVRYRREPARRGRRNPCDDSRGRLVPRRITPLNFGDCRTHRARTLLEAPTGRVFRERRWWFRSRDFSFSPGWFRTAYACLYAVKKPVRLGVDEDTPDISDLHQFGLAGPYVEYLEELSIGPGGAETTIIVRDLRSGATTRRVQGLGVVVDLELKSNGSVAWIDESSPFDHHPRSVWAADSLGQRMLDSGNIGDRLQLDGSTVTWVKDGVVHSATLY